MLARLCPSIALMKARRIISLCWFVVEISTYFDLHVLSRLLKALASRVSNG